MNNQPRVPPGAKVAPALRRALSDWQAAVVLLDEVDPVTTELVRLRAANHHDCRVCKSVRAVTAGDAGVDETMIAKLDRYETSDLPERHKIALRLADALMTQPRLVSDEVVAELRAEFTDAELLELTLDVMKWNYQKAPVAQRTDLPPAPGQLVGLAFDDHGHHQFIMPEAAAIG